MFKNDFVWGAGSSSYQVEGAWDADGKGPSIWDTFCRKDGAIVRAQRGDIACDHYNRYAQDVGIMAEIGLKAYRFSIAWPRVLPEGTGRVNKPGLDFYDKLTDALLDRGIDPWVTLFHWDYPLALQHRGGWLNPDSVRWFAEFAAVVVDRLSDRVRHWITINEPQIFIGLGHFLGTHAPGLTLQTRDWLLAGHHALMAHGAAVQVIRARAKTPSVVGWAPCGRADYPASTDVADIEAARRRMFSVHSKDAWNNSWWADPVCLGHYPEDGLRLFAQDAPNFTQADMDLIRQPIDFYGVNIYSGVPWKASAAGPVEVPLTDGSPQTGLRWTIMPDCLYWGPKFIHDRYKLPVVITENGMANNDWVDLDGRVQDPQRIDYTRRHLIALANAARDGTDIRGYFHWSIMDNFEWAEGAQPRFGLVHIDYQTQKRTPKSSAYWYSEVIRTNGRNLPPADRAAIPSRAVIVEPRARIAGADA